MSIEDEDGVLDTEVFKIYERDTIKFYDVYLSDEIESGKSEYSQLCQFFHESKETDGITLHLASFGGCCHNGFRIAHAIKNCRARTHIVVEAPCYSMGAILALSGDTLEMRPGTFLMFHNFSTVESGKGGEIKAAISEFSKHFDAGLEYFCSPFLSKSEIKRLQEDRDVYIHSDSKDMKTRISRHFGVDME